MKEQDAYDRLAERALKEHVQQSKERQTAAEIARHPVRKQEGPRHPMSKHMAGNAKPPMTRRRTVTKIAQHPMHPMKRPMAKGVARQPMRKRLMARNAKMTRRRTTKIAQHPMHPMKRPMTSVAKHPMRKRLMARIAKHPMKRRTATTIADPMRKRRT
jgi:hypothetical protein